MGIVKDIGNEACTVKNLNWISIPGLDKEVPSRVKIRYRHSGLDAMLIPFTNDKIIIKFNNPAESVTPGQSAVFYDGDRVLGGGIIDKAYDTFEEIKHE